MITGKRIKKIAKLFVILVLLAFAYKHNPYQVEFLGHYDKIWAHRVNTTAKLNWSTPFFIGVELDLVFTDGILDVRHPPLESTDLSFEHYLKSLDADKNIGLWLDIKNLEPANASLIHERISSLLASSAYDKSLLLIESQNPDGLKPFLDDGFRCSYYLPVGLHSMSKEELSPLVNMINEVIMDYPSLEISSHFRDYELMQQFNASKNLWITRYSRFKDYKLIRSILADSTVNTVLIPYRSVVGNR
ncbi:MAG: hypothetical protein ABJM06_09645 [Gilvibacter sp.]